MVFSTLEMQQKSLYEEKRRNSIERFNSRFYPILSNLRTDASNMEIIADHLSSKGIGTISSYKGEKAFKVAKSMINGIKKYLGNHSFKEFDKDEYETILHDYSEKIGYLYENDPCPDDIDRVENERKEYIKTCQVPYLIDKWNITRGDRIKYQQTSSEERENFLLNELVNHQSTTLSKYIQSLRFILQIIREMVFESEKKEYYYHVSCLIGKEELEFLRCFSEFNVITNICNGQK